MDYARFVYPKFKKNKSLTVYVTQLLPHERPRDFDEAAEIFRETVEILEKQNTTVCQAAMHHKNFRWNLVKKQDEPWVANWYVNNGDHALQRIFTVEFDWKYYKELT